MQRTGFIGGSDLADVFSLPPYGCERRLMYVKRGVPADYPFYGNVHTDRGHRFEPVAAEMYSEETGRPVVKPPESNVVDIRRHPKYQFIGGHPDYFLPSVDGILEIKVPGERTFRKIKAEGMSEGHILQLQHYLLLYGADLGAFAFLWADGVDLRYFDVEKDRDLQEHIVEGCAKFWERLGTVHQDDWPRLDPGDRRCQTCSWRTSCQGPRLIDLGDEKDDNLPYISLDPLILQNYFECKEMVDESTALLEGAKDKIKSVLRRFKRDAAEVDGARIYWRWQDRTIIDSKRLKAEMPDIYEKYSKSSPSTPFRVFAT